MPSTTGREAGDEHPHPQFHRGRDGPLSGRRGTKGRGGGHTDVNLVVDFYLDEGKSWAWEVSKSSSGLERLCAHGFDTLADALEDYVGVVSHPTMVE